jgi:hypothetical protein
MKEKRTYRSMKEFRETAEYIWKEYLDSLEPGEEPKCDMEFFGVVKIKKGYVVTRVVFNPSQKLN